MKPIISHGIVVAIFLVFALISFAGIWLIYNSQTITNQPGTQQQTKIETQVNEHEVKINITTISLGIIVFIFGAAGLILLLIKIPVKRILGYEKSIDMSNMMMRTPSPYSPQPILSENIEMVPLIFWLWMRNRDIAIRE